MPRVIVKCRYYNSGRSVRDIGGMLRYIGTREGVEKPVEKTYLDYMGTRSRVEKICGEHGLFSDAEKQITLMKLQNVLPTIMEMCLLSSSRLSARTLNVSDSTARNAGGIWSGRTSTRSRADIISH